MTFEERMDRLAERHEALAQSVEMHNAMLLRIESTQGHQRELLEGLMTATNSLLTATDRLVQIANRHEARISKLESRA